MDCDTLACDETLSYPYVSYNDDDFFALIAGTDYTAAKSASIVDQVGLFSDTDPGASWPVCGAS